MSPFVGVKRRDADQSVDSGFLTQVAISIISLDPDGDTLDAGFFPGQIIEGFRFVAFALGVTQIHAQKHLGPVLRLRAAGAGMDAQDAISEVVLLEIKSLKFGFGELFFEFPNGPLELIPDIFTLRSELGEDFRLFSFLLQKTEELEVSF